MPNLVDAFRSPAGLPVTVPTQRTSCRRLRSGLQEHSRVQRRRSARGADHRAQYELVLSEDLNQGARERIEREATDETQTPEAALIAKLEAQHVRKAMASLPAPFREVLVLTNSAARAASGGDE